MQTCGNTSLSLRFSADFLMSTKCKVIFAVANLRNSSAQFFKPAWCSNFISCPIVLSTYISTSHCLKQFCDSVFSPLMLFWTFIIRKLCLICRKCPKNGYYGNLWKESISASRSVKNVSDKLLRIEVQPAHTNGQKG